MPRKQDRSQKSTLIKILIAVVAVLLAVNIALLIFLGILNRDTTSASRNNVIGVVDGDHSDGGAVRETTSLIIPGSSLINIASTVNEKLTLSFWTGYDGRKSFQLENLMPGDTETREYTIIVKSKEAEELVFEVRNLTETKVIANNSSARLADALVMTVTANGKLLYSGTIGDMLPRAVTLQKNQATQTVTFKITVSLPTSAGNEVAGKRLTADFYWTLEESEPIETDPSETGPVGPGPIETDPVETDPIETDPIETDPIETDPIETDPIETDPIETDPIETDPIETDPIETDPIETDPIETDPIETDPIETDPPIVDPPVGDVHDGCCRCLICHWLHWLFGIHNDTCITCGLLTLILGADNIVHICPWGCIIVIILILCAIYLLLRRKKEKKDREDDMTEGQDE